MFATGAPMGTVAPSASRAVTTCTEQPTTVSVGPYSLTTTAPGASSRQSATVSAGSASPPTTKVRTCTCSPSSSRPRSARCAGVSFTSVRSRAERSVSASPATSAPSGTSITRPPDTSGASSEVTVRSKESDECTGEPSPSPAPYASAAQWR